MKQYISLYIFLVFSLSIYSQGIMIEGKNYAVDTILYQMQIGPGVYHSSYRLPGYPLDFHVMEVDLTNPYNQIETVKALDKAVANELPTSMGARKNKAGHEVVAGTNGDFYIIDDVASNGIPRSGQFSNGEIIANPTGRASFILGKNKKPYVDRIDFRADLFIGQNKTRIHTVNTLKLEWEPKATDFLILYTEKFGPTTGAIVGGTKVVVRPKVENSFTIGGNDTIACIVESVHESTGISSIPAGKAVLHGRDAASALLQTVAVGSEITIASRTLLRGTPNALKEFKESVGGSDCIILKNGNPQNEGKTAAAGLNPRTGMGFSQDSTRVFMVVVDGRSGRSVGLDLYPFGELFKAVGAWNAVNNDGGGSSVMFVNNQQIVNRPSGGVERAVGNGVLVISTAPEDAEVGMIKPHKSKIQLPRYGEVIPQFYGYNKYGKLLNADLQGVVLTSPESLGRIVGNKFVADGTESGQITATYNGDVIAQIEVSLLPVSGMRIRLDSVLVDNRRDYRMEVVASTEAGESLISPEAFVWETHDQAVATVENGIVKGVESGSTLVTGKINDISDEIKIIVQNPTAPTMIGDSLIASDWTMTATAFLKAQWNTENLPAGWQTGSAVNFVHAAGRAPFIKLTNQKSFYGLPDTVKLTMNVGNIDITRAILTFKNNLTQTKNIEFTTMPKNQDFSLDVPVDELFDTNDLAIYPVSFDNINFYLDAANMTPGTAYSLAVKEIALVYKDYIITHLPSETSNMFRVYPNPISKGKDLKIKLMDVYVNERLDLRWYDLHGKLVKGEKLLVNGDEVNTSTREMERGTYLLNIKTQGKTQSVKIILK